MYAKRLYKFTVFEIWRDFHILRVRAIPTLESTDSMILLTKLRAKSCVQYCTWWYLLGEHSL